jgi:hypothetical protein
LMTGKFANFFFTVTGKIVTGRLPVNLRVINLTISLDLT